MTGSDPGPAEGDPAAGPAAGDPAPAPVAGDPAPVPVANRRPIVSFAPRGGRLNDVQRRAWDAYADRWLIERATLGPIPDAPMTEAAASGADLERAHTNPGIDQQALFGREAPLVIEIGPGMGDATAAMAAARPDINLLAIEVYKPGVAQTFSHLARAGVDNVRVLRADAAEVLRNLVIPGSLAEVWLFFPDPWPKRKHHKRRIVSPAFASLVASRLAPGGSWYLATDWQPYAAQMRDVLAGCAALSNAYDGSGGWAPRPWFRPETRFEKRGVAAERAIYDLHVTRS